MALEKAGQIPLEKTGQIPSPVKGSLPFLSSDWQKKKQPQNPPVFALVRKGIAFNTKNPREKS